MKKLDFFLNAFKTDAYKKTDWVIRCFSQFVTENSDSETMPYVDYPYQPVVHKGMYCFLDEDGVNHVIEDADPETSPIASIKERVQLKPGDMENVDREIDTIYGNVILNQFVLVYAFGRKIPFVTGRWSARDIEAQIEQKLIDDPEDGEVDPNSDAITMSEYFRYTEAGYSIVAFSNLSVPTATDRSLRTPKEIITRRDELIEQNKDHLDDPAVMARIEDELIGMMREHLKGDDSEGFYIKGKHFRDVLKKTRIIFGLESGLDPNDAEAIVNNLEEGWDYDKLPTMVNALRMGSIFRGKLTELGGVASKEAYRAFQNSRVTEDDCGTKLFLPKLIQKGFAKDYVGLNHMVGGKPVEITEESINSLVGKVIYIRFPMLCATPEGNHCKVCVGRQLAKNPDGLASAAADVGSTFLSAFMKKMHVSSLTTARYNFKNSLK